MAAVKGYSKYIWDYENGKPDENVYGQYFSHGSLARLFRQERFDVFDLWTDYDDQYLMIETRPSVAALTEAHPAEESVEECARMARRADQLDELEPLRHDDTGNADPITGVPDPALDVDFTIALDPDTAATRTEVEASLTDLLLREAEPGDGAGTSAGTEAGPGSETEAEDRKTE